MHLVEVGEALSQDPDLREKSDLDEVVLRGKRSRIDEGRAYDDRVVVDVFFDMDVEVSQVKFHVASILNYNVH